MTRWSGRAGRGAASELCHSTSAYECEVLEGRQGAHNRAKTLMNNTIAKLRA
jgi:hypothetical protein